MCTGMTARVERDMSVKTGQDFVNKKGVETLYIGFLYMSADGSIYTNNEVGFDGGPMDVKLTKFDIPLGKAQPPVGSLEHIMIVGTSEPFDWSVVAAEAPRGLGGPAVLPKSMVWTMSYLPVAVTADDKKWSKDQYQDATTCDVRQQAKAGGGSVTPACAP